MIPVVNHDFLDRGLGVWFVVCVGPPGPTNNTEQHPISSTINNNDNSTNNTSINTVDNSTTNTENNHTTASNDATPTITGGQTATNSTRGQEEQKTETDIIETIDDVPDDILASTPRIRR